MYTPDSRNFLNMLVSVGLVVWKKNKKKTPGIEIREDFWKQISALLLLILIIWQKRWSVLFDWHFQYVIAFQTCFLKINFKAGFRSLLKYFHTLLFPVAVDVFAELSPTWAKWLQKNKITNQKLLLVLISFFASI